MLIPKLIVRARNDCSSKIGLEFPVIGGMTKDRLTSANAPAKVAWLNFFPTKNKKASNARFAKYCILK